MYDARGGTEGWQSMNEERISLRLGFEELRLMDDFLDKHPEYTSRSQLARIALKAFIEGRKEESRKLASDTTVTIRVPPLALRAIKSLVRAGVYNTINEAIEECIRKEFISKAVVDEIRKRVDEIESEMLEILPDSVPIAGKDQNTEDE